MDNIVSQQIPHDSDAEKAVLGAIFIDPEAIADPSAVVQPEDFYERANQIIFQAMLDLSDRGDAIDPLTLQDELEAGMDAINRAFSTWLSTWEI